MQTRTLFTRAVTAIALTMVLAACSGASTGTRTTPQASTHRKAIKPASCASASGGSCSTAADLTDNRFDGHVVPFSPNSTPDATADVMLSIQRHWFFTVHNDGPGTVGTASISAGSSRTFSTTPPPPFTATGGPLAPGAEIRTAANLESAFVTDSAAPGYTSSRSFDTVVVPPGGGTQTMTGSFTLDAAAAQVQILLDSGNPAATWSFTGCSPACSVTPIQGPGPTVQVFVNGPAAGTAYSLTFSGVIPNASAQAIAYKPRLLFQAVRGSGGPPVFANTYSTNDPVLGGTVVYTLDDAYELHPSMSESFGVDYAGGNAPAIMGSFPANGAFVIADNSAAIGNHVTFWGAQWAKQNSPSGGPAPRAFKGFEGGSQPSACKGVWTGAPGNSVQPPAAVPDLMMVLVASTVSHNGSEINGDVAHIVVVKTDAGYGSDPGFPGTGTVVARIC